MHYINIEGLYWEMRELMQSEVNKGKPKNQAFLEAQETVINSLKDILKDNKEDLLKEV